MNVRKVMGVTLFCAVTGCHPAARGQGTAYTVDFPGGWTRAIDANRRTVLTVPLEWDVRQGRGAAEWLFRVKGVAGPSDECYAVRGGAPVARRAVVADCTSAPEVKRTASPAGVLSVSGFQGVAYENRQYAMSGNVLGKALVSGSRRWLALLSVTPSEGVRSSPMQSIAGGEPTKGEVYLDVYDTTTGVRKANTHAPFAGFGPRIMFEQAFWVEDSVFVLPVNLLSDRCFVVLPELQ